MRVAFHCSAGTPGDVGHALANVRNLLDADGDVEAVALVANGDAVTALVAGSPVADDVLALPDVVDVRACRNSLDARELDEADLLDRVEPVPAGVGRLARLQEAGYRYLKVP